jgi:hypothetical protein
MRTAGLRDGGRIDRWLRAEPLTERMCRRSALPACFLSRQKGGRRRIRQSPVPAAGLGCAEPAIWGWRRSGRRCGCGCPVVIVPWAGG